MKAQVLNIDFGSNCISKRVIGTNNWTTFDEIWVLLLAISIISAVTAPLTESRSFLSACSEGLEVDWIWDAAKYFFNEVMSSEIVIYWAIEEELGESPRSSFGNDNSILSSKVPLRCNVVDNGDMTVLWTVYRDGSWSFASHGVQQCDMRVKYITFTDELYTYFSNNGMDRIASTLHW